VRPYCQTLSEAFQAHLPPLCLVEEGGGTQPESDLCLQPCDTVLHSLCTAVNDYMRCEAVENQPPEGCLQDGK